MTNGYKRGDVVLSDDPYSDSGKRPMLIISDDSYPFYPHGYLGVPITSKNKSNTVQIHDHDMENVQEDLHIKPSYVNPWSPSQVNTVDKYLFRLSDDFVHIVAEYVANAIGLAVSEVA